MRNDSNDRGVEKQSTKEDIRPKLIAGTALAATSTLGSAASIQEAQAQPAPSGERPNIVVIMGDDIGCSNKGSTRCLMI